MVSSRHTLTKIQNNGPQQYGITALAPIKLAHPAKSQATDGYLIPKSGYVLVNVLFVNTKLARPF